MTQEALLVKDAVNGDMNSFKNLMDMYYPLILTFIMKMNVSKEDSEDITQEVFIKLYNNLYKYNEKWKFSTWIFKIAVNTYKNFRKKKRSIKETTDTDLVYDKSYNQDEFIENIHQKETIKKMLSSLNPDVHMAVELHYIYDFSFKEIGRIIKTSPEAVGMKIYRARNSLRKKYLDRSVDLWNAVTMKILSVNF